ncbi:MAG: hypothetical protein ACYC2P_04085 [Paludibacteraceae bacterium]
MCATLSFSERKDNDTVSNTTETTLVNTKNKIFYTKSFGNHSYYYNGKIIDIDQVMKLIQKNPNTHKYLRIARALDFTGNVLSITGTWMLGWYVGALFTSAHPDWRIPAIGGGLALISIPVFQVSNNNFNKGINIYNQGNRILFNPQFNVELAGKQEGPVLVIHF